MLVVRHPLADLRALQRDVDRLFRAIADTVVPAAPVEVRRSDDGALTVRVELPGVDPAAIAVEVDRDVLSIRAERPAETRSEGRYLLRERPVGSFAYRLQLPADVDATAIAAEAKHGVLTVRVPKRAELAPRAIPVTVE